MKEQIEIQPNEEAMAEAVKKKLNFLYSLDVKVMMEIYNKIYDLANQLQMKYPDARKYYLFHIIIGSTPERKNCSAGFDFPGEDSIVKHLDDLYREYKTD